MRLRRERTNLRALVALHVDFVASDTCDSAFRRERTFQKLLEPICQDTRAHAELIERSGIGIEDLAEAFVGSQKTRLRKAARSHSGFHFG